MGWRSNSGFGWITLAAVALVASVGGAATLTERAPLREGPNKDSKLIGSVAAGTTVTIESEHAGWLAVRMPDGTGGYVWQGHLHRDPGETGTGVTTTLPSAGAAPIVVPVTPPPATSLPQTPPQTPPPTAPPEVRLLTPPDHGDPGVATELAALRTEVTRLSSTQQELLQRLSRRGGESGPVSMPGGSDGSAGAAALFLAVGAAVGWVASRLTQGRRERRSRIRL